MQAGSAIEQDGVLRWQIDLQGGLHPARDEANSGGIFLRNEHGKDVVRYDQLQVRDATGSPVPAQMEVHGRTITLVADARAAEFPVVIDPLIALPVREIGAGDLGRELPPNSALRWVFAVIRWP